MFLYQKIAKELKSRLANKQGKDARLPSERQLCLEYNVSRITIRKSIALLKSQGLITSRIGKGTFIETGQSGSNRLIAFVLGKAYSTDTHGPIHSISKRLIGHGYDVIYTDEQKDLSSQSEKNYIRAFERYQPAGYILFSPSPHTQKWFSMRKLCVLVMGNPVPGLAFSYVNMEQFPIFHNAVHHLSRQGHKNIALLFHSSNTEGNRQLLKGFHTACEKLNIPQPPENIIEIDIENKSAHNVLKDILKRNIRPTALILHNQDLAIAAMTHLQHEHVKIPEELAIVVGYADALCDQLRIRLTHSTSGNADIGKITADGILSLVTGKTKSVKEVIPPKLIIRESSQYRRR